MRVEQGIELRLGRIRETRHLPLARIVHKVIERFASQVPAEDTFDVLGEGPEGRDVSNSEPKRDGFSPEFLSVGYDGICLFRVAAKREDDIAAAASDAEGGVATEATVGTRHERDRRHQV